MMQSMRMALKSIAANKLRALLTMLGIIIGVMALVILVSLVSGASGSVTDKISEMGSNYISVTVIDDKGLPVRLSDLKKWSDMDEFGAMTPVATSNMTAKYGTADNAAIVYGVNENYYDILGMNILLGRFIKNSDVENHAAICVLDESSAEDLVGYTDCIGEEISLNGSRFTIAGVVENDDSLASIFQGDNAVLYIPYTSLMRVSTTVSENITSFYSSVGPEGTVDLAEDTIEGILYDRFAEDEDAYRIISSKIIEDAMSSITDVLSVLLGGIAAISLIVGGIGIMNIMLVTVTERTREIGVRKAIGATRGDILLQFLIEAVVICMIGCAIGIFFSWSVLRVLTLVVSSLSLSFAMDASIVVVAVVFCFVIGVIFGLYPANKAAKMAPIDALHYGG